MVETAVDLYGAAFLAASTRDPDGRAVTLHEPGFLGVVRAGEPRAVRLLVTDDRGYDPLVAEVAAARQGVALVFDRASRCDDFLCGQAAWTADRPATAMVLRDVRAVPVAALPDGLAVRPVRRLPAEASHGSVPLEAAVAVALASDPGIREPADRFAAFLRGLPASVRLFAAVDDAGVARATSGCDGFGDHARIFFVNTEPAWRRRGIGLAMTREALRAAAASGARRAFLHATDDGASVYARLGFEAAARLSRYARGAV